jgi:hypothetical protein
MSAWYPSIGPTGRPADRVESEPLLACVIGLKVTPNLYVLHGGFS